MTPYPFPLWSILIAVLALLHPSASSSTQSSSKLVSSRSTPPSPVCVGAWPPYSPLLAGMLATAGIQTSAYSSVQAFCAAPGALADCRCHFVPERDRWDLHCAVPAVPVLARAVAYCNQWCYCVTVGSGPELFRPAGVGWRAYRGPRVN